MTRRALLAGGLTLAGLGGVAPRAEAAGFDADALLIRHGFKPEEAAWVIIDLATGALLAEKPQRILGPPASAAKLPAMLASLGVLGAEHRFETRLMGSPGEATLVGAGDPLLDSEALQTLLPGLAKAGPIQRFHYDASALPELVSIDARQPLVSTYNPSVSALTVNFNRMQINWRFGDRGLSASALSPSARAKTPIDTVSFLEAPAETDAAILYAPTISAEGEVWRLNRKLNAAGAAFLPLRNASPAAAAIFARLAQGASQGAKATLPKPQRGTARPDATLLARHESQALVETVPLVLAYSNNLAAELIALTAARKLDPNLRDLRGAGAALAGWLRRAMPQTDWTGFHLENGSGLTTQTRISARQLADIVRFGSQWGAARSLDFMQLMAPVEGRDLKDGKRVVLPPAWAFRAKSGTMEFSRALAGSFVTASGRAVAFGLTLHDPAQRERTDKRFNPLVGGMSGAAADWLNRARAFEVELARGFIGAIA